MPFDDAAASHCAALAAQSIGPFDALIASIARANDLTLVTHHTREFGRVSRLRLEDWE